MASTAIPPATPSIRSEPTASGHVASWRPLTAVLTVAAGVVATLVVQVAVMAIGGSAGWARTIHAGALVIAEAPLLVAVLFAARRGAPRLSPSTFGIRRTRFWPALGWSVVVYFAIGMLEGLYLAFVRPGDGGVGGGEVAAVDRALLLVVGIAIVAPIVEELAFRGYLFAALTRWRGPWIAALASAALFAVAHLAAYPPALLPLMAIFGFGSCLLFWFTGSLLPSIGLHALNNGIVAATVAHAAGGGLVALALLAPVIALVLLLPVARRRAPGH